LAAFLFAQAAAAAIDPSPALIYKLAALYWLRQAPNWPHKSLTAAATSSRCTSRRSFNPASQSRLPAA